MATRKKKDPVRWGSVEFAEQIAFFRQKLNLPTRAYTDLVHEMHGRAFVVAGAMQESLLVDLREAVDKAIANGTTLAEFRKDFDDTVTRHGWPNAGDKGSALRAWRTRVIYETNLRTSYQAGRYVQLKKLEKTLPFWEYVHSAAVRNPREEHLRWNGLTLPSDHSFWQTHYPPNGWGCRCRVRPRSAADVRARGLDPDNLTAPPTNPVKVTIGKTGPSPREVMVPEGIDPGWGYNPGEHAWGVEQAKTLVDEAAAGGWVELPGLTPASYDRPATLPSEPTSIELAPAVTTKAEMQRVLESVIGGETAVLTDPAGGAVHITPALLGHIGKDVDRARYLPFLPDVIEHPAEIWVGFAKHTKTGRVEVRRRYVKLVDLGKTKKIALVADATRHEWIAWTFFQGGASGLDAVRQGVMVYAK